MEIPTEVVTDAANKLSDTAWGAILVVAVALFVIIIFFMAKYIRSLHSQLMELAEKRVTDANEHSAEAQAAAEKSLTVSMEAKQSLTDLTRELVEVQRKVDLCHMRAQGGGQ